MYGGSEGVEFLMYVARVLKKTKSGYKGVRYPSRWRSMTWAEQRAWNLGVDMALAAVKRLDTAEQ
jgi:hypothetical protein